MRSTTIRPVASVLAAALMAAASVRGQTVSVRGLIDMVAAGDEDVRYLNTVNTRDSNFDPLRARLFIEGARGNTQVFLQFLLSQESFDDQRLYGAYVMHRVFDERDVWIETGKIPVHDGIWASHTYSNRNPLLSIPLAYYWKSNLPSHMMPVDLDQLLESRGLGQTGVYYADSTGARGTPYSTNTILYDNCWNYGLYTLGTLGRVEFALGVTYGPPAAPVASLDSNEDLAIHAKLGYAITPGLRAWVSASRGAYLSRDVSPYLPAGKSINDYFQDLLMVSADWSWGYLSLMGEVMFNRFETPLTSGGLSNRSFYVQGVYTVLPGVDLAARYDEIRFERVEGSAGSTPWDTNVHRVESGVVYHLSRDLLVKGVVQATDMGGDGWKSDRVIPALQMVVSF